MYNISILYLHKMAAFYAFITVIMHAGCAYIRCIDSSISRCNANTTCTQISIAGNINAGEAIFKTKFILFINYSYFASYVA